MNKRIIYLNDEGTVSIIIPASNSGLTVQEIAEKDVPTGKTYKIVNASDISNDRTFRNAWVLDANNDVEINITKAKDVWKDKIRVARKPALEKLDVDYNRAVEDGNSTTQIVTDKNTLRDLPDQVDTATTIDEIKGVWNSMLGDKD